MLASEVLGRPVVDSGGRHAGVVHDLRVRLPRVPGEEVPVVTDLVVGPGSLRCRLAYAWGYAQGRGHGPALLRVAVGTGAGSRRVPANAVADWDDGGRVRLKDAAP